jgi:hypothetical protein
MTAEVSAVVAIVAALIACLQVVVSRSTSQSAILRDAMSSHWSPDSVANRDIVYALENKDYDQWTTGERDVARSVAIQISQVGFLLRNSYADRKSFLDFWAPWCVRLFTILAPLIAEERDKKNAPDQWVYFEWLARRALRYMARKPWWESRSWKILKSKTASLPDPSAMLAKQRIREQAQQRPHGNKASAGKTSGTTDRRSAG